MLNNPKTSKKPTALRALTPGDVASVLYHKYGTKKDEKAQQPNQGFQRILCEANDTDLKNPRPFNIYISKTDPKVIITDPVTLNDKVAKKHQIPILANLITYLKSQQTFKLTTSHVLTPIVEKGIFNDRMAVYYKQSAVEEGGNELSYVIDSKNSFFTQFDFPLQIQLGTQSAVDMTTDGYHVINNISACYHLINDKNSLGISEESILEFSIYSPVNGAMVDCYELYANHDGIHQNPPWDLRVSLVTQDALKDSKDLRKLGIPKTTAGKIAWVLTLGPILTLFKQAARVVVSGANTFVEKLWEWIADLIKEGEFISRTSGPEQYFYSFFLLLIQGLNYLFKGIKFILQATFSPIDTASEYYEQGNYVLMGLSLLISFGALIALSMFAGPVGIAILGKIFGPAVVPALTSAMQSLAINGPLSFLMNGLTYLGVGLEAAATAIGIFSLFVYRYMVCFFVEVVATYFKELSPSVTAGRSGEKNEQTQSEQIPPAATDSRIKPRTHTDIVHNADADGADFDSEPNADEFEPVYANGIPAATDDGVDVYKREGLPPPTPYPAHIATAAAAFDPPPGSTGPSRSVSRRGSEDGSNAGDVVVDLHSGGAASDGEGGYDVGDTDSADGDSAGGWRQPPTMSPAHAAEAAGMHAHHAPPPITIGGSIATGDLIVVPLANGLTGDAEQSPTFH